MSILLFLTLWRLAADSDVVKDTKRVPLFDKTDDSCITHPVDRDADGYCTPEFTRPIIEVKWENFPDIKMEVVDESYEEYQNISVKVS